MIYKSYITYHFIHGPDFDDLGLRKGGYVMQVFEISIFILHAFNPSKTSPHFSLSGFPIFLISSTFFFTVCIFNVKFNRKNSLVSKQASNSFYPLYQPFQSHVSIFRFLLYAISHLYCYTFVNFLAIIQGVIYIFAISSFISVLTLLMQLFCTFCMSSKNELKNTFVIIP